MKLLKLKAYNFVLFKKIDIDFGKFEKNLIFITGKNFDVDGANSNGSGKSLIADLFTDLLFDKTTRKHSPVSLIGKFAKYSVSYMSFYDPLTKEKFSIRKYRKHSKHGDKVFFSKIKGKKKIDISGKDKADTYANIGKVIGISWRCFKNRNYYGQGDPDRFLNVTDARKAEIISEIIGLEKLRKCKKISNERQKEALKLSDLLAEKVKSERSLVADLEAIKEVENERIKKEISRLKEEIVSIQSSLEERKREILYSEKMIKGIDSLRFEMSDLKIELKGISSVLSSIESSGKQVRDIKEKIAVEIADRDRLIAKISRLNLEMRDLKNRIVAVCSKCGANLNEKRNKKSIISVVKEISETKAKVDFLNPKLSSNTERLGELESKHSYLLSKKSEIDPLLAKEEVLLKNLRKMEKWEARIPALKERIESLNSELEKKKKLFEEVSSKKKSLVDEKIIEAKSFLSNLESEYEKSMNDKEKNEFSKTAFEKAMRILFTNFLDHLNFHIEKYLNIISSGEISIKFRPRKDPKRKVVDEIMVDVSVCGSDSRPFRTYCGGEKGRMEIANQLALFSSALAPFPFLFLDEPFIGVDIEGRDRIVLLLEDLVNDGNMVFVISHDDILSSSGENLLVSRKGGESVIS